jgi:5-formyltetrahydrofolate cyclo-ligase
MFYPVKGEPNILPFAEKLLKSGVHVAFPISLTDTYELDFRYVNSLEEMVDGAYGIPEPKRDAPRFDANGKCVCLVPALAFDRHGMRIGYGKGFYDRFLAKHNVIKVGVCYEKFICDVLPTDKNDICVDTIITEKGVILPDER